MKWNETPPQKKSVFRKFSLHYSREIFLSIITWSKKRQIKQTKKGGWSYNWFQQQNWAPIICCCCWMTPAFFTTFFSEICSKCVCFEKKVIIHSDSFPLFSKKKKFFLLFPPLFSKELTLYWISVCLCVCVCVCVVQCVGVSFLINFFFQFQESLKDNFSLLLILIDFCSTVDCLCVDRMIENCFFYFHLNQLNKQTNKTENKTTDTWMRQNDH